MGIEYVDIVDDYDKIIDKTSVEKIYANKHLHRIVHILIFNRKGEMALQFRSKHKAFCPHHWGTSVGGHVQSGENYEQAALREMEEELGTKCKVTMMYKDLYEDGTGLQKFLGTFKATFEGPFKLNPEEVDKLEFFGLEQIQKMIDSGEKIHPELLFILRKHFGFK
jgi:isopentenyldiphosphate isomerase